MFSLLIDLDFLGNGWLEVILYVGNVILTDVFVKDGIVDPNVYGFLNCPGEARKAI